TFGCGCDGAAERRLWIGPVLGRGAGHAGLLRLGWVDAHHAGAGHGGEAAFAPASLVAGGLRFGCHCAAPFGALVLGHGCSSVPQPGWVVWFSSMTVIG